MCKFICAIIPRALFILASLGSIGFLTGLMEDVYYWFLAILLLPLVIEMIITLKTRKGQDYKWFSPPIFLFLISIIPSIWILELNYQQEKASDPRVLSTDCSEQLPLFLYQILLLLLIVGKWLLPLGGGVTREELSQLLLIFVGTAADILEFTSETLSDVKETSPQLVYIVLSVWTWSMLQFPLHMSVVKSNPDSEGEQEVGEVSLLSKYSTDIWSIVTALFIQDGPFLVVRLTVMIYYNVFHQMLLFFTVKNFLVVILNVYRFVVICQDSRSTKPRSAQLKHRHVFSA
ncbi:transmembrane protein 26-like isoform X1 [Anarhichas minor]|uniref:transmembrane protein 26-like isoform X1 n=1 Tax=Anarhichas minor TaxID=65739 RepID=UPI003F73D2FA